MSLSATASSSSLSVSSTLPRTNSLRCPLITSSFSCTIFPIWFAFSFQMVIATTSFYQRSANHVSFYLLFNLRNLFYLISALAPILMVLLPVHTSISTISFSDTISVTASIVISFHPPGDNWLPYGSKLLCIIPQWKYINKGR